MYAIQRSINSFRQKYFDVDIIWNLSESTDNYGEALIYFTVKDRQTGDIWIADDTQLPSPQVISYIRQRIEALEEQDGRILLEMADTRVTPLSYYDAVRKMEELNRDRKNIAKWLRCNYKWLHDLSIPDEDLEEGENVEECKPTTSNAIGTPPYSDDECIVVD
jgi:hypothetical protein